MAHTNRVLRSIETDDGGRCVDLFARPDGSFGFEEYRNGVRFDRHRVKVRLKAGVNTVLVKVCQAPLDPSNREPNLEFLLRVCDASGKGVMFKSALPNEK